jgi:NAD(P)-dependent dehydrogenase (short-subunit alcohol dehydrogenase family)
MRLKNKVAIITGAASGIGRSCAILFAKEGAHVIAADRNIEGLNSVAETIKKEVKKGIITIEVDISQKSMVENMVKKAIESFGKIDILLNIAGVQILKELTDMDEDNWQKTIDTNLKGTFLCTKYVIPHMIKGGGGSIVNMSSTLGYQGLRGFSTYSATKGGIIALTSCTAIEYADKGIRINCICPGPIRTPLMKTVSEDPEELEKLIQEAEKKIPLRRIGEPEDVAKAALFLASDDSSFVTGTKLIIDGGITAQQG